MLVVDLSVDRCGDLALWVPNLGCAELGKRVTRVRVVMRTADALARSASPDMLVLADGKEVHSKGTIPRWQPPLQIGSSTLITGVAELPEPTATALGSTWSLSVPPTELRGSLSLEGGMYHLDLELTTRSGDDARRVQHLMGLLTQEDGALQVLGFGDFKDMARSVKLTVWGSIARASLEASPQEIAALVERAKVVDLKIPDDTSGGVWIYIHDKDTLSTKGFVVPIPRLEEFLTSMSKLPPLVLEYPTGTSHGAITQIVGRIRAVGGMVWVSSQPAPEPRFPPLLVFDAPISDAQRAEGRKLMQECYADDAQACNKLEALLELEKQPNGAVNAFAQACRLGHRPSCARSQGSPAGGW